MGGCSFCCSCSWWGKIVGTLLVWGDGGNRAPGNWHKYLHSTLFLKAQPTTAVVNRVGESRPVFCFFEVVRYCGVVLLSNVTTVSLWCRLLKCRHLMPATCSKSYIICLVCLFGRRVWHHQRHHHGGFHAVLLSLAGVLVPSAWRKEKGRGLSGGRTMMP